MREAFLFLPGGGEGIENFNWPRLDYRDYYLGREERDIAKREREKERKKEGCASSNPIVLVTLKEPSMPEHDTVEYVFYIFSKHLRPVRSRRSMAIHNATAYLSSKRGGGREGVGSQKRKREKERISRDRHYDGKIIPPSREPWNEAGGEYPPFFLGIFLLSDRLRARNNDPADWFRSLNLNWYK